MPFRFFDFGYTFEEMIRHRLMRRILKSARWLAIPALVIGYGLLPGKIEGNYSGAAKCLCGSLHFLRLSDGKAVLYSCEHPPAHLFGRYEMADGGSALLYDIPLRKGEPEKLLFRAHPRKFFTKFVNADDGTTWRGWKLPLLAEVRKAYREQEIKYSEVTEEGILRTIFYSRQFEEIRRTEKPVGKPGPLKD